MPSPEDSGSTPESKVRSEGLSFIKGDPLLALRGSGRALWADEPADAYVQRLREGWS